MGRETRARYRRLHRADAKRQDEGICTVAGWCAEDNLEEGKRQTHDSLIKLMGAQRTGGVRWHISQLPEANGHLDDLISAEGTSTDLFEYYREIRAHLREYGGHLVIAMAAGRPAAEVAS